jgi:hypothetical protein
VVEDLDKRAREDTSGKKRLRDNCANLIDISSQIPDKDIEEHHGIYKEFKRPPNQQK